MAWDNHFVLSSDNSLINIKFDIFPLSSHFSADITGIFTSRRISILCSYLKGSHGFLFVSFVNNSAEVSELLPIKVNYSFKDLKFKSNYSSVKNTHGALEPTCSLLPSLPMAYYY